SIRETDEVAKNQVHAMRFSPYINIYFLHLFHRFRGPPSPQGEGFIVPPQQKTRRFAKTAKRRAILT
ncbi:MAG: hypothetical protein II350_02325, partial [Clostridia bacterium]|nr:hypothetical protein [Clostridia bacterium]